MSDSQLLFDLGDGVDKSPPPEIAPIAAPVEDLPRLKGQNGIILEYLRCGPMTNVQLAEVSLKYTSRISDIRKWLGEHFPGAKIECESDGKRGGVRTYRLTGLDI